MSSPQYPKMSSISAVSASIGEHSEKAATTTSPKPPPEENEVSSTTLTATKPNEASINRSEPPIPKAALATPSNSTKEQVTLASLSKSPKESHEEIDVSFPAPKDSKPDNILTTQSQPSEEKSAVRPQSKSPKDSPKVIDFAIPTPKAPKPVDVPGAQVKLPKAPKEKAASASSPKLPKESSTDFNVPTPALKDPKPDNVSSIQSRPPKKQATSATSSKVPKASPEGINISTPVSKAPKPAGSSNAQSKLTKDRATSTTSSKTPKGTENSTPGHKDSKPNNISSTRSKPPKPKAASTNLSRSLKETNISTPTPKASKPKATSTTSFKSPQETKTSIKPPELNDIPSTRDKPSEQQAASTTSSKPPKEADDSATAPKAPKLKKVSFTEFQSLKRKAASTISSRPPKKNGGLSTAHKASMPTDASTSSSKPPVTKGTSPKVNDATTTASKGRSKALMPKASSATRSEPIKEKATSDSRSTSTKKKDATTDTFKGPRRDGSVKNLPGKAALKANATTSKAPIAVMQSHESQDADKSANNPGSVDIGSDLAAKPDGDAVSSESTLPASTTSPSLGPPAPSSRPKAVKAPTKAKVIRPLKRARAHPASELLPVKRKCAIPLIPTAPRVSHSCSLLVAGEFTNFTTTIFIVHLGRENGPGHPTFQAHESILARSPILAWEIKKAKRAKANTRKKQLFLFPHDPVAFEQMLQYLYKDTFKVRSTLRAPCEKRLREMYELFALAKHYVLPGLQRQVVKLCSTSRMMEKVPAKRFFDWSEDMYVEELDKTEGPFRKLFARVAPALLKAAGEGEKEVIGKIIKQRTGFTMEIVHTLFLALEQGKQKPVIKKEEEGLTDTKPILDSNPVLSASKTVQGAYSVPSPIPTDTAGSRSEWKRRA